jgi:hypothetical protein
MDFLPADKGILIVAETIGINQILFRYEVAIPFKKTKSGI